MPLVEVIRGAATSEGAVRAIVAYSKALGKTPIVVKDGPGFLVNRVLTPYMMAASRLIADGCDFTQIDRVMQAFGWPMGPAWLNDVIGMDVGRHVTRIISGGFADRMQLTWADSVELMVANGRLGQKTGLGFYRHDRDEQGKPRRTVPSGTHELLATVQASGTRPFADQEIVERMMVPMIIESARALEEETVGTPAELDLAMTLGLGFPKAVGGPLRYADAIGLEGVVAMSRRYEALGPMYRPTSQMLEMARASRRYHP
jgi:3-hydroxyacyl-CoA dehydrogenase/enoyl-CoA hydratase/3-hydroxybutyryl-CoA epimerase/enoyl-CoA isomerase